MENWLPRLFNSSINIVYYKLHNSAHMKKFQYLRVLYSSSVIIYFRINI